MNLASLLERAGRTFPTQPAIAHGERILHDYGSFSRRCAALAGALRSQAELVQGDRIALFMKNSPEYLEILFAAWHAGITVVPVNAKLSGGELKYILGHSGARICFTTPGLAETVHHIADDVATLEHVIDTGTATFADWFNTVPVPVADLASDDAAWLFYTSGTTGTPKGAMLTHRNLITMNYGYFMDVESVAPGDSILHAAPLSHGSGLYVLPHVSAAALQIIPESGGFDADEICDLLGTHRSVSFFAAPTMVKRLTQKVRERRADTTELRNIIYGGGPMYLADLRDALDVFGNRLVEIYGQGETPMTITAKSRALHARCNTPEHAHQLASVGMPNAVVDVRVVGDDGATLPANEVGEIIVRGDTVMSGYWQNPEATREAVVDGWLYTGDRGCMDEYGLLYLKDRSKDVIISGGTNIYTKEVEDVLLTHPGVFEVSVVGRPDPEWGEVVVAFVVATDGGDVTPEELDQLCLEKIARFKRPKEYFFVDDLPKNAYGKIVKNTLRERLRPGTD
ncbi:AMP-binding protein [Aquisalimonas asiatica]|uniref:Acyl-CoA synthetase (AMP-forming)/AMP-acid ligase II n=1 Tax=Aquisalimonas asiatica TaxID=406100 RepID=A0A1H8S6D6_9GAMM|nr:AMP-binding protein [Aquisalimonas asiatica]SEO74251.1 Acyl-CoA synthetase (AMP-forming)/AMP-acid ligase II [Aquisalimonas asiatica]